MPENIDNSDVKLQEFEEFLNKWAAIKDLSVMDMNNFTVAMYIRLRSVLTPEELHQRAHALVDIGEAYVQSGLGMVDDEGNHSDLLLIENFEDPQAAMEMMASVGTEIDDAEIIQLFGAFQEEE